MRAFFKVALFAVLLLSLSSPAYASFAYKVNPVVDPTKVLSNATDFAVLFSNTDNSLKQASGGAGQYMQNESGYDARAFSDSTCSTALDFELDFYDGSAGTLIMWIRIPTLSGSVPTGYWICFGDASLNSNASSTGTWASQYIFVAHYGNGTALSVADSTSYANNLTNHGATATTGLIDGGANFSTQYADITDADFKLGTGDFTISLWAYPTTTTGEMTIFDFLVPGGVGARISSFVLVATSGSLRIFSTAAYRTAFGSTITANVWNKISLSRVSGVWNTTVNTTAGTTPLTYSVDIQSGGMTIGKLGDSPGDYFSGILDEQRISKGTALSADWITAEYNNQSNPTAGGFYTSITYSANSSGGATPSRMTLTGAGH